MPDIHFACPKCNQPIDAPEELANQLTECPTCKETIEVPVRSLTPPPDSASFAASAPGNESIFFQSGNIMVTNARFVIGAKTFAMRSITSVKTETETEQPPLGITGIGCLSVIIFVIGLVIAFYGFSISSAWLVIFGILILAGGIWLAIRISLNKPKPKPKLTFTVVLTTAGGEVTAFRSDDQDHISKIIRALNDSIIAHG